MELQFEVLASATIKRKKPWPKFAWLSESEPPHGLYLLDRCRISQVSPTTGKTRKKLPSLASVQSSLALVSHSHHGVYVGGLTRHGDLFLWKKDTDSFKMFVSPLSRMDNKTVKNDPLVFHGYKLFISDGGEQILLVAGKSAVYLWELSEDGGALWWKIFPPDGVLLPDLDQHRETAIEAKFYVHPVFGESCSCVFIFTSSDNHLTTISHLVISWSSPTAQFYSTRSPITAVNLSFPFSAVDSETSTTESDVKKLPVNSDKQEDIPGRVPLSDSTNSQSTNRHKNGSKERLCSTQFDAFLSPEQRPFQTSWSTVFHTSTDPEETGRNSASSDMPTRRGSYVCRLSPTGSIAALAINRRAAVDSSVAFFSPLVDAGTSSPLYLSKMKEKYGRTYWVSDMSWFADGLLLACITRRGSVIILPRFGRPLKLVTHGQSLDMGPALSLPLHPLVTVSAARSVPASNSLPQDYSQSSEVDVLRQRFSVSAHPCHPVLVCSDGYSFSILQLVTNVPLSQLVTGLVLDARSKLLLSPSSHSAPSPAQPSALLHCGEVHDFAATLTCLQTATDNLDTSLDSTMLGLGRDGNLFASLEGGALQFAGVDSDLEQTQSSLATSTANVRKKKKLMDVAVFHLRASLGLLLSCGRQEPGNGVYPHVQPLDENRVRESQRQVQQACVLFLSTFLNLVESSIIPLKTGADSADATGGLFHELLDDVLGLLPLDSYSQSHLELATTLINGVLLTVIKSFLKEHDAFSSRNSNEHSIHSLKLFADHVSDKVSFASELLTNVVVALDEAYGMKPLSHADSAFHAPLCLSKKRRRKHKTNVASYLSVSLTAMLDLLGAFWQDIQVCGDMANEIVSSIHSGSPQHGRAHLRELGVLCKALAGSLQASMATLKTSHAQIRQLIQPTTPRARAPCQTGVEASARCPTAEDETSQDQSTQTKGHKGQSTAIKGQLSPDGKPITSIDDNSLYLLLSKLEQCDLKGAMEVLYADNVLTRSFSATNKSFDANASFASVASLSPTHHHLSLVSPSARPAVACLARLMMAFFTNRKLLIPPPSTVTTTTTTTSSTHLDPTLADRMHKRFIELKRSDIVQAVRDQELSKSWTPDYTLELALVGGLWEEVCQFVACLGEWKKSILLSLAYVNHTTLLLPREGMVDGRDSCLLERLSNLTHETALSSVINLLGVSVRGNEITQARSGKGSSAVTSPKHCTEETFHAITGTLQICAAGKMDSVLTKLVTSLTQAVSKCCQQLTLVVHSSLYLPAPPLYCPQPSIPEEEYIQCPREYTARYSLSHLIHSLTLVLRASNCLHSCAQWYSRELQKLTKSSQSVREAFAPLPGNMLKKLPQALSKIANSSNQHLITGEGDLSSPVVRLLLSSFRQLCCLLWLLHVRDQASAHLRKLQPSLSKTEASPDTLEKAALWCCRLTLFDQVLGSGAKYLTDVHLNALSALSELPNGAFLANLLAVYFPNPSPSDRRLHAKFQRLMTRLRSTHDPRTKQLLSVIYQTKSQQVLIQQSDTFGDSGGQFCQLLSRKEQKLFECGLPDVELCTQQALDVGCFLFEYDTGYLEFLDTLFAVSLHSDSYKPTAHKLMLSTISPSSFVASHAGAGSINVSILPLTSKHIQLIDSSKGSGPCWERVLPLLHVLKEWADIPQHQLPRSVGKVKGGDKEERGVVSAMRVNVQLGVVVSCLKQREEELLSVASVEEVDAGRGGGGVEGSVDELSESSGTMTRVSSIDEASGSSPTAYCGDQTMLLEELEVEGSKVKHKVADEVTSEATPSLSPLTSTSMEDSTAGLGDADLGDAGVGGFPLLQVPVDLLQGSVSGGELPSAQIKLHRWSHPLPAATSRSEGVARVKGPGAKADVENGGHSVVDVDVSESVSVSEFPSDITLSIGEVVSKRRRPKVDSFHSTLADSLSAVTDHQVEIRKTSSKSETEKVDKNEQEMRSTPLYHSGADSVDGDKSQATMEQTSPRSKEDSSLTLTQSTASLSALTLTEVSRLEHTQSTLAGSMPAAREEVERESLDKTETAGPLTGGEDATVNGGGEEIDGEGEADGVGGVTEEREIETKLEAVEERPTVTAESADDGVHQRLMISDIVKSEMRKILEVQHQQLLSLLGNVATPPTAVAATSTFPSVPLAPAERPRAPPTGAHSKETLSTHSHKSPHSTPQTSSQEENNTHNGGKLKVTADPHQVKPVHTKSDREGERQTAMRLSDLNTCTESTSYSLLASSVTDTDTSHTDFDDKRNKKTKGRERRAKPSRLLSRSHHFSKGGGIQLLRLEPLSEDVGGRYVHPERQQVKSDTNGRLEDQFPGLAKSLKQFNEAIKPRFSGFAPPRSNVQPHTANVRTLPLLRLPSVHDEAPPLPPPPCKVAPMRHQDSASGGNVPMPLLIIPNDTIPPRSHPIAPSHVPVDHPKASAAMSYRSNAATRHDDFKLAQISVRPFVPFLLPPDVVAGGISAHDPSPRQHLPLLQLNDPLSQMKREGFKLLKVEHRPDRDRERSEGKHSLEVKQTSNVEEVNRVDVLQQRLVTAMGGQTRELQTAKDGDVNVGDLQVSSTCSLTTVSTSTAEESSEMLPAQRSREGKLVGAGRRQRRSSKRVAWKLDQGEKEEMPNERGEIISADKNAPNAGDSSSRSGSVSNEKGSVDHSSTSPPASVEATPLRQPLVGTLGGPNIQSYPNSAPPLERLEIRRLEMKSSLIPSSPQHHEDHHSSPLHQGGHHSSPFHHATSTLDDSHLSSLVAQVETLVPQTNEVGVQVSPPLEASTQSQRPSSDSRAGHASTLKVSCAVQVSPEHTREVGGVDEVGGVSKDEVMIDALDVAEMTSVSSLDSEEDKVQLSDSDDDDHLKEVAPTGVDENEFTPPPLWYNSHSPIPIPTTSDNRETDSPIPDERHVEEMAPPTSSLHTGFSTTPPPPLPLTDMEHNVTVIEPKDSVSPTSNASLQIPQSLQTVFNGGSSKLRPHKSDVIERLHQIEDQLSAIESTARDVEGDFKSTKKILYTIDRLQAVSDTLTATTSLASESGGKGLVDHGRSQSPGEAVSLVSYPLFSPTPGDIDPEEREFQHIDRDIAKLLNAGPIISRSDRETPGPLPGNQRDGRELMESEKVSRSRGEREQPRDTKSLKDGDTPVDSKSSGLSGVLRDDIVRAREGRGKEELRAWMAAKRRERLAQFVAERDRLRNKEKRPFHPPPKRGAGKRSTGLKQLGVAKRDQVKQFVSKRIEDAYSLMNDILTSKPTDHTHSVLSSSPLHSNAPTSTRLPPRGRYGGRGKVGGARGKQRRRAASGMRESVGFSTNGLMTRSHSDSKLYKEQDPQSDDAFGGSVTSLHGTYTMPPCSNGHAQFNNGVGDYRSRGTDLKQTHDVLSLTSGEKDPPLSLESGGPTRAGTIRRISSVEGLTQHEQNKIAEILASTDCDMLSISSGSVVSNIDWDQVDRILDN